MILEYLTNKPKSLLQEATVSEKPILLSVDFEDGLDL
jgi:hypothetical protein